MFDINELSPLIDEFLRTQKPNDDFGTWYPNSEDAATEIMSRFSNFLADRTSQTWENEDDSDDDDEAWSEENDDMWEEDDDD